MMIHILEFEIVRRERDQAARSNFFS